MATLQFLLEAGAERYFQGMTQFLITEDFYPGS
jgi:hypothetical protein